METSPAKPSPYFVNPVIDAIFVCGGLPWAIGLAMYFYMPEQMSGGQLVAYGIFLQILVHLFNDAHVGATWVRLYSSKESRRRFRLHAVWLAIGLAALGAASLYFPEITAALMKIYMVAVLQHYIAQAYGVAMIYCGRNNYVMTPMTRGGLKMTILTLTLWICAIQLSPLQIKFYYVQTPYLNIVPLWAIIVLRGLFFISLILFLSSLLSQTLESKRPPPWTFLCILASIFVFMAAGLKSPLIRLIAPPLFHASQYLVVSGVYVMRERGIQARQALLKNSLAYSVSVVILGYFGYQLLPNVLTSSGFQSSLAAVFAPMSLHHFLADRAMWRLRDSKTRSMAVGSSA